MEKNEGLAEQKKKIRREALARRDLLTAKQRMDYSSRIQDTLTTLSCYAETEAVLIYVSFRSEVDTFPLIKQALADKKAVFAPRVLGRDMEFYRIFSVDDLAEGYHGILEPEGGIPFIDWISQESERRNADALLCLPGAAFDRACHRIGYGGGFYDRYLARFSEKFSTAALAFACQIFEDIPWESHDIIPSRIITEREIIGMQ